MARTVFVLGAGASRHTGAPLMNDFFRAITELQEGSTLAGEAPDFDLIVRANSQLDNVYAKLHMGYHENIESLLATFEMASILGTLGSIKGDDLSRLPSAMKRVIASTIEKRVLYKYVKDRGFLPHEGYLKFVDCLKRISASSPPDVAILTFNYDYALEYAFYAAATKTSYCLPDDPSVGIPVLKMHGSLNWGQCPACKAILPYTFTKYETVPKTAVLFELGDHETPFQISARLPDLQHCGAPLPAEPFIVPPTWNKTRSADVISPVWQRAARELASARSIFIVGYSFPPTDEFFRHLLALSLAGGPTVERLVIVNPSTQVFREFEKWVGDKLQGPLKHIASRFEDSSSHILREFHPL